MLSVATDVNPLSAKLRKWPNTLKQFVGNLPTNCLSVFGHFVGLALKGLMKTCCQYKKYKILDNGSLRVATYKCSGYLKSLQIFVIT